MADAGDPRVMQREELPALLRDTALTGDPTSMMAIVVTKAIALQLADDIEYAVSARPGIGYGSGS